MNRLEKLTLAAMAIVMHLPMSATEVETIEREYEVDHREVMNMVAEMYAAKSVADADMNFVKL